ncbi:MAG: hypothetical protein ACRBBO_00210 [Cognatishimia sp.]
MKRLSALLASLLILASTASAETLTQRDWRNMANMVKSYVEASHKADVYTMADLSEPQVMHKLALMAGTSLGKIDYTLLPFAQEVMKADPNYYFRPGAPMKFSKTETGRIYGIMPIDSSLVKTLFGDARPLTLIVYRERGRWYMWEVLNAPEFVALAGTHEDFTNAPIFFYRK